MAVEFLVEDVVRVCSGQLLGLTGQMTRVLRISTDTRLINQEDLFVALIGKKMNGHDFIPEALEKGVRFFIVQTGVFLRPEWLKKATFVIVADTLTAYGDLARFYRLKFNIPLIVITGSSGKTTVKEITAHLLSSKYKVLKNIGTENNLIGVPKTLFQLDESFETAVIEIGTSLPGEIARLSQIACPSVAILTQIGHSHLEGLKNIEGVREEKLSLIKNLEKGGALILNGEDENLKNVNSSAHKVMRVGFDSATCDLAALESRLDEAGTKFVIKGYGDAQTALLGKHNILNILLAFQASLLLGVSAELLKKKLADFKPVPGRLCVKKINGVTFLDDTYNSNPTSFLAALEVLKSIKTGGKKGVICGDMLELGDSSELHHRQAGQWLLKNKFDFVVTVGKESQNTADEVIKRDFPKEMIYHADTSLEAGKICHKLARAGDSVLVKGSRGMRMERVFECFMN